MYKINFNNNILDVRHFSKIKIVGGGEYDAAENCGQACSRNENCLVWDYNVKTKQCRLFVTAGK